MDCGHRSTIYEAARCSCLQVADWAREHFEKEVDAGSGSDLNIPKLCMLIALEEEAAEAAYGLPPRSDSNNERFQRVFFPEPDR